MAKSKKPSVNRRNFLKSAVVGATTLAAPAATVYAEPVAPAPLATRITGVWTNR